MAIVLVNLAEHPGSSRDARAAVIVDQVVAGGAVLTRRVRAFIDVKLTVDPLEAGPTATLVAVDVIDTRCPVMARSRVTFIDLRLAVRAFIAALTPTTMGISKICTRSVIPTQSGHRRPYNITDITLNNCQGGKLLLSLLSKLPQLYSKTAIDGYV